MTLVRRIIPFLLFLGLLLSTARIADAADLSGKYYSYRTTNGVRKIVRDQWVGFQSSGRCISREAADDSGHAKRIHTAIAFYEVIGNYLQITSDNGFATYEIAGDRSVSGDHGYIRASTLNRMGALKKAARKK
jgi:hypothetical protein